MKRADRTERAELAALRAYARTGSTKSAAFQLGLSDSTIRQRLASYYARTGFTNAVQAVYYLDRPAGWRPPA